MSTRWARGATLGLVCTTIFWIVSTSPPLMAQAQTTTDSTPGDLKAALVAARALINEGKPQDAIAKLRTLDDSVPEVGYLLGVAYYHADDTRPRSTG